jgi:hypothetical protein
LSFFPFFFVCFPPFFPFYHHYLAFSITLLVHISYIQEFLLVLCPVCESVTSLLSSVCEQNATVQLLNVKLFTSPSFPFMHMHMIAVILITVGGSWDSGLTGRSLSSAARFLCAVCRQNPFSVGMTPKLHLPLCVCVWVCVCVCVYVCVPAVVNG